MKNFLVTFFLLCVPLLSHAQGFGGTAGIGGKAGFGGGATASSSAPVYVSSASCASGSTSCTPAGGWSSVSGNLHVYWVISSSHPNETLTLTDSNCTGLTQVTGSPWTNSGVLDAAAWTCVVTSTASSTPTCGCTGTNCGANQMSCVMAEYSGQTGSPIDQIAEATFAATTAMVTGTSGATGQANETLVGLFSGDSITSSTAGGSYTQRIQQNTGGGATTKAYSGLQDLTVSSTGAYQATATGGATTNGIGVIITLK